MRNEIKAIDFMYHLAMLELIAKWTEARKGELICRMEKTISGCGTTTPSFSDFKSPFAHKA
jgi:hypothetical protein